MRLCALAVVILAMAGCARHPPEESTLADVVQKLSDIQELQHRQIAALQQQVDELHTMQSELLGRLPAETVTHSQRKFTPMIGQVVVVRGSRPYGWNLAFFAEPALQKEQNSAFKAGIEALVITWPSKKPNQSPEPTAMSVTPRADARVAPATTVAHL